ncbi:YibE/F family protein [Hespellia stercorisuis]|uniref:YibE/F-like protein n=1 Tax=Hespellia stercorisuis DSM 15480 TaxID=1121950 RepID=A0A1M6L9J8_9FIRM|nr:YibE/F family protein [Hespellia stercorisuis]SHJ67823.1 YibE/F-like protein [Hespellia stercorisuis DSM 15480]
MILILAAIFFVLILLIGGERGAMSLIALCGNIIVFIAMILLMSSGIWPVLVTIAGSLFINGITLLYQNGRNKKTIAAVISVACVMLVLFVGVFLIGSRMHLNGLNEIELKGDLSMYYSFNIHIDMNMVCISLIIIGLLGAVMDTAVAISSAIYEVHVNNPSLSKKMLFRSGITMGRDVLATTLNTLYFAYIGEALMLFLYLQKYNYSVVQMINSKAFLQDFSCIMFSAIGCLIVIPLSAYVSSTMFKDWD